MMIPAGDLPHVKDWRLRRLLRHLRMAIDGNEKFGGALRNLMRESLADDINQITGEIDRRKAEAKERK